MSGCRLTSTEVQGNQCNKGLVLFVVWFLFLYMGNLTQ